MQDFYPLLPESHLLIGRSRSCQVVINEQRVSRTHLKISADAGAAFLVRFPFELSSISVSTHLCFRDTVIHNFFFFQTLLSKCSSLVYNGKVVRNSGVAGEQTVLTLAHRDLLEVANWVFRFEYCGVEDGAAKSQQSKRLQVRLV